MESGGPEARWTFVQGRVPSQWLVDQMPEAIWATDAALRFVVVGGAGAAALGLDPDRVLGTSVYDYLRTTDPAHPALAAHLHALRGESGTYRYEHDGRIYHVRVGPLRHAVGRVVGVVACATDVTELVAAAEQAWPRLSLEAVPLWVVRVDEQLHVRYANAAARRWLEAEALEPTHLDELPRLAPLAELARRAWHLGQPEGADVPWMGPSGEATHRWYAAPELDPQGNRRGVVLVGWDNTDAVRRLDLARREAARWEAWGEAAAALLAAEDLASTGGSLLRGAQHLTGARHAGVALWDRHGARVAQQVTDAWTEPAWDRLRAHAAVGEAVWLEASSAEEASLLGLPPGGSRRVLVLGVPGQEVAGVLCLAWDGPEATPPEDASPLVRLARLAGAVASAHVRAARLRGVAEHLERVLRVAGAAVAARDLQEAMASGLRALAEALPATGVAVYAQQGDVWVRVAHVGERQPAATLGAEEGAVGAAAGTGQVQTVHPARQDPAFVGHGAEGVAVPLSGGRGGYVLAVESLPDRTFTPSDRDLLRHVAGHLEGLLRWQEQAESQLAQVERYRRMLDAAPVGTWLLDGSRVVRYANGAAAATVGRPREDLVGRPLMDWVHPEDRAEASRALSQAYAQPRSTALCTVRLVRGDGGYAWVDLAASNRLEDPAVAGLVVCAWDVSVQREAQEQLAVRAGELDALREFGESLRGARTVPEAGPRVVEGASRLSGAEHAALVLWEPDGDSYTVAFGRGALGDLSGASFPLAGVCAHVLGTGEAVRAQASPEDPVFGQVQGLGPVLAVPVRTQGRTWGVLAVARSARPEGFDDRDAARLQAAADLAADVLDRAAALEGLERAYTEVLLSLARAMDAHDGTGPGHGSTVAHWAEAVARRMGCSPVEAREVRWAALLHNVGKVAIPEEVLRKTGPLSAEELALVQRYPVIGEQILEAVPRFRGVAKLVRHHRERWDGGGYPDGLKGEEIPLGSRILAVVDAYNAMTDHRRYRVATGHAEAVAELRRHAGSQFDPEVVRVFVELLEESRSL